MVANTSGYPAEVFDTLTSEAETIVARYPQARSALLPLLHLVQSQDGYVSPNGIAFCADVLDLSRATVSAVATFYSQYKRRPNGQYTVGVCTNTLCAVMGGDIIFDRLSDHLGIGHDETTEDGKVTLERVECNAACDFAPVVMINWEFFDNQTPASILEVVDKIIAGEPVAPTRGPARVPTFKQTSRLLAGFEDGLADEGVAAAGPTLVGLQLARDEGWHAPEFEPAGGPSRRDDEAAEADADLRDRSDSERREPEVGEEGSSAERQPTTSGDVSPSGPGDADPAHEDSGSEPDPDTDDAGSAEDTSTTGTADANDQAQEDDS